MMFFFLIFVILPILLICYGIICILAAKYNWGLVRFINMFEDIREKLGITDTHQRSVHEEREQCRNTGILMIAIGVVFWLLCLVIYAFDY